MSTEEDKLKYARGVLKGFLSTFENPVDGMSALSRGLEMIAEELEKEIYLFKKLKTAAWMLKEEYTMEKLTRAEINHLLELLKSREIEEVYYGNKEQYEKRAERIKQKLRSMIE